MRKKSSKRILKKYWTIAILGIIMTIIGTVMTLIAIEVEKFLTFFVISFIGAIIFDFSQLFLYSIIDKEDRLD